MFSAVHRQSQKFKVRSDDSNFSLIFKKGRQKNEKRRSSTWQP
jgi:hypothetical protein